MPKTFTLKEYPNPSYINTIAKHPDIYETQVDALKAYCDKYNETDGSISIDYVKVNEYGRYFVKDPKIMSCTVMWNKIRATLFAKSDYDIDIQCCHQSVMATLLKNNTNYDITHLEYYCANRDKVIESISIEDDVITDYNNYNKDNKTKKDIVKSLFTIILYGGTIDTWRTEYGIKHDNYSLTQFVKDYIDEIQMNTNIVIGDVRFKHIVESVKSLKIKEAKDKYKKKFNIEKFKLGNGAVLSVILQEYETLIIEKAMEFVKTQNCFVTSYNYDGFQIKKVSNIDELVNTLNNYINKISIGKFIFENITFIVKPFKEGLVVPELPVLESINYDINEMTKTINYKLQKEYFERFHTKIENPFCYIRDDENGIMFIKPSNMNNLYANIKTTPQIDIVKSWCYNWEQDKTIKTKYTYNYYPDASLCPVNCCNLWKPFPILKTPLDKSADTSKIDAFIKTILGDCTDYVLNWLAHIVQKPWRKTEVCILLYGSQGCGKSTIGEYLLRKIIGLDKMIITSKADKMFGKFVNSQGKLLAVLNEASGKDTFNICDILKDAITMTTTEQEKKGVDAVAVTDYTNFIFTTNNINSVKIPEDDRRFMPIEINEELKNNKVYFKALYADLDNAKIMRKFYEELMKRPLEDVNLVIDRPETELMIDMKAMNRNCIKQFITYWKYQVTSSNSDDNNFMNKTMKPYALYDCFNHFWEVEGRKTENKPNSTKFGIEVKQFKEDVMYKTINGVDYYEIII
jgi:hypothetical protein